MTGVVIRIMRDGKPINVDFDQMSVKEMRDFLREKNPKWVMELAVILGGWIRDNVQGEEVQRD